MLERARRREPDSHPQIAFRTAADWPVERQALLRRVLLWRDATARRIDRPRPWILDDPRVLEFASRPPKDAEDLFERSKGLRALRSAERSHPTEAAGGCRTRLEHPEMAADLGCVGPAARHAFASGRSG